MNNFIHGFEIFFLYKNLILIIGLIFILEKLSLHHNQAIKYIIVFSLAIVLGVAAHILLFQIDYDKYFLRDFQLIAIFSILLIIFSCFYLLKKKANRKNHKILFCGSIITFAPIIAHFISENIDIQYYEVVNFKNYALLGLGYIIPFISTLIIFNFINKFISDERWWKILESIIFGLILIACTAQIIYLLMSLMINPGGNLN